MDSATWMALNMLSVGLGALLIGIALGFCIGQETTEKKA